MKNLPFLRRYFGFSAGEARGFALLLILMLGLLIFPLWLNFLLPTNKIEPQLLRNQPQQNSNSFSNNRKFKPSDVSFRGKINLNLSNSDSLVLIGMPPFLAQRIENYRAKGGYFKSVEDLKKIYGVTQSIFDKVKNQLFVEDLKTQTGDIGISLPQKPNYKYPYPYFPPQKRAFTLVELNQADTLELELLPEIGPATAKRIVDYRQRLGGFIHPNQIYEIWGIDSFRISKAWPYMVLKPIDPQKIKINSSNIEALKKHPYGGYRTFKLIDNFRRQKGPIENFEQLFQIKGLDSIDLLRLKPYLDIK